MSMLNSMETITESDVNQQGNNQYVHTYQVGSENSISVSSVGSSNQHHIHQEVGNANTAKVEVDGNSSWQNVYQVNGDSNFADISIIGDGNGSYTWQDGEYHDARVTGVSADQ